MSEREWLAKEIQARYLPFLRDLQDSPKGHEAAKKLCLEIRKEWADRSLTELSQQQGCMDQLRRALKDSLGEDHFSLDYVCFSTEEYIELNNQKQKRISDRNEQVKFLADPDAIVAKAVRLLESPEWSEIAAGLALLTGRRITELLSTAQFEKKSKWSVTFTGALKRKGEVQTLSFEIPTLTTADKVINALEKIRRELPEAVGLPASNINRSYQSSVIRACDRHFSGLIPIRDGRENLYTHGQRAVYAAIAAFWYCPASVNETEYKAAIQGHYQLLDEANPELRRSLAASRHYSDYEIADSVIAQHQGKRKGIKLGIAGIEPIEIFRQRTSVEAQHMPKEKKTTAHIRIWNKDRETLEELLKQLNFDQIEGVQQDKIGALLAWVKANLQNTSENREQAPLPAAVLPTPTIEVKSKASETLPSNLEAQMGTLIETMNKFMEFQMNHTVVSQPKHKASVPEEEQAAEPKQRSQIYRTTQKNTRGEADGRLNPETERILNQAIDAIMAWNDEPARIHDHKWAITINILKSFANSQPKIQKVLASRAEEIKAHHEKHEINPAIHNLRHRGKEQINKVIQL